MVTALLAMVVARADLQFSEGGRVLLAPGYAVAAAVEHGLAPRALGVVPALWRPAWPCAPGLLEHAARALRGLPFAPREVYIGKSVVFAAWRKLLRKLPAPWAHPASFRMCEPRSWHPDSFGRPLQSALGLGCPLVLLLWVTANQYACLHVEERLALGLRPLLAPACRLLNRVVYERGRLAGGAAPTAGFFVYAAVR